MSATTTELDRKTYGELLKRTLPQVIRSEEEYDRITEELLHLDELKSPSPEEQELAELLTILVENYEERRYPIPKPNPRQALLHLMDGRNLTQKDMWKIFGSKGITSEVFHGKRAISKAQARKLAAFFHVGVEIFI